MLKDPARKYRPFPQVDLPDRQWPTRTITAPPRWLSTDLRDGNQSLIDPMNGEKKARFFKLLTKIGVKEIEVGFPSASQTDFDYVRGLVDKGEVPDDVFIQGLTQSRDDLIDRTFESMAGAKQAIVHLYNAVSPAWRDIVFKLDRDGVKDIAKKGAERLRWNVERFPETDWHFEYSPETFSTAELDFSLEISEAVMEILEPSATKPLILNLPATIEASTPNIYADQIEWMCRNISAREKVVISLHPHNDRGTGVAAAELGLIAGGDRIEGCLFGNGERTGNVDLVTLGLNLYTQGVDPGLDFSNMDELVQTVEYCNQLPVHPRHPYAGELVFTAFSGSHQDAIKKGFEANEQQNSELWRVPYLPIDPQDLGRSYEAVIRVNSQSGKGGVAWVMQQDYGLKLPKRLQADFSRTVQAVSDETSRELTSKDIWTAFEKRYLDQPGARFQLVSYSKEGTGNPPEIIFAGKIAIDGEEKSLSGRGNGLLSSLIDAIRPAIGTDLDILDYSEHSVGTGTKTEAASYIEAQTDDGRFIYGVGMDSDVGRATVKALLSAANSL